MKKIFVNNIRIFFFICVLLSLKCNRDKEIVINKTGELSNIQLFPIENLNFNRVVENFIKEIIDNSEKHGYTNIDYELCIENLANNKHLLTMKSFLKKKIPNLHKYVGYMTYKGNRIFLDIYINPIIKNAIDSKSNEDISDNDITDMVNYPQLIIDNNLDSINIGLSFYTDITKINESYEELISKPKNH